ncbi:hypothetical protein [Streptomyces sp. ACT015]|uniref:hypothetical protein n=1 Tax=Streptomyces sp. ACT015 TaxID=3134807 RepID=UPI003D1746DE
MENFEFRLEPRDEQPVPRGFTGDIGPFGPVLVTRPRSESGHTPSRQVLLSGPSFPAAEFGGGAGILPSLNGGWLKIEDTPVEMDLRGKGVRKGSRWLELRFGERHYKYTSFGYMRQARLTRDEVTVTLDTPDWKKGEGGPVRYGKVEGEADATDLAIALVLEEVDKYALTATGALMSIPSRVLFGRGNRDEGSLE